MGLFLKRFFVCNLQLFGFNLQIIFIFVEFLVKSNGNLIYVIYRSLKFYAKCWDPIDECLKTTFAKTGRQLNYGQYFDPLECKLGMSLSTLDSCHNSKDCH